ncbi:MAG: hypothetical protein ABUL62_28210 [Myxococcales bacterium]
MNERPDREAAKRRIMFVAGEDFYFLTYTLLVLLRELKAASAERALVDSRKLSYVADFLSSDADLQLAVTSAPLSSSARSRLALLYDRAVSRRIAVERLVEALATRGLIQVSRPSFDADRVHLVENAEVAKLLDDPRYSAEAARLKALRKNMPLLRTMTLETLKERLFAERGVRTWGD